MNTKIYSPESGLRSPGKLILSIWQGFSDGHHLAWRLFIRNISARYRQSFLGLFWALIPPLVNSLVWIFLNSQKVVTISETGLPYPVFVITGTMLWQLFTESITGITGSLSSNKNLLVKLNFPREALLMSAALEALFNTLIKLFLLVLIFVAFGISPSAEMIQWLPGILGILFMGWTIGLILVPFTTLIPDIQNGLGLVLQFAMYLTPVIYPQKLYSGWLWFLNLNPLTPFLDVCRSGLQGTWSPQFDTMILVLALNLLFFCIGIIIYKLSIPIIIERMGS